MGLKDLLKIGSKVSKPFLPAGIGMVLEAVNESIEDKNDPANEKALTAIAEALVALDKRLDALEK